MPKIPNPKKKRTTKKTKLPAYQEPFDQEDFRGYFRWTDLLSDRLCGHLYHACHEDEFEEILQIGELPLRSNWQLRLPEQGMWSVPGVWCGLNDFSAKGNYYGPCLMKFPITVLQGRHFMVFQRKDEGRMRYFFVQHESGIPIYNFDGNAWRWVKPESYFSKMKNRVYRKVGAIYDIVLTAPLALSDYTVVGVEHPRCISENVTAPPVRRATRSSDALASGMPSG